MPVYKLRDCWTFKHAPSSKSFADGGLQMAAEEIFDALIKRAHGTLLRFDYVRGIPHIVLPLIKDSLADRTKPHFKQWYGDFPYTSLKIEVATKMGFDALMDVTTEITLWID